MRVTVIGTGYVGLVAGACLAEHGNEVVCVDIDGEKVERLKLGEVPFYEPGLDSLVLRNQKANRLSFTTDLTLSVRRADVMFIAVGTPEGENGEADLGHVLDVVRAIGRIMDGFKVIVLKSTVPVGTADKVRGLLNTLTSHPFEVVSNPEFLKEGAAVEDFMRPDRVVIGTSSEKVREIMADLYAPYMRTADRVIFMDNRSAEMTKYAANAILASRISFMNEMANLCERVDADITQVRRGVGSDNRIGSQFLFPGVGFGGSCFPKDLAALRRTALQNGMELRVLKAVEEVNADQKRVMVNKVLAHFGSDLSGKIIAIWGLAFKPGTDDMREAPSLVIIEGLLEAGAHIRVHDPEAMENARRLLGDRVEFGETAAGVCRDANALIVVTEWPQYRNPDFEHIGQILRERVIFDGRNLFRRERLRQLGFFHYAIGRGFDRTDNSLPTTADLDVGADGADGVARPDGANGETNCCAMPRVPFVKGPCCNDHEATENGEQSAFDGNTPDDGDSEG